MLACLADERWQCRVGLMLPRGEEPPERHQKGKGVSKQGDRRIFTPFLPAKKKEKKSRSHAPKRRRAT